MNIFLSGQIDRLLKECARQRKKWNKLLKNIHLFRISSRMDEKGGDCFWIEYDPLGDNLDSIGKRIEDLSYLGRVNN